jgi:hypothetical protein
MQFSECKKGLAEFLSAVSEKKQASNHLTELYRARDG